MIPLQLTLKNFLSYRDATLDFRGLHVACICGSNGAGKSSLLEAIAWAVWGQSRALAEDDVIHLGTTEALVDFVFQCHQQVYRVIRTRYRGQASTLEFQVQTPNGFRTLTEKGIRATQQLILTHLKLDYDTFINSAYLRQGRADEFMLKRPSDRKQILADLLKLDQYDDLAEQAKEQARQFKAELGVLERSLEQITTQLQQDGEIVAEQTQLKQAIAQMQAQLQAEADTLRQHRAMQQQRQTWQQQLLFQQQQQQHLRQDWQRLQQDLVAAQQQQHELDDLLRQAEAIASHYAQFRQLQADEETQTVKFQAHQTRQAQRQQLQQQLTDQVNQLKDQRRQAQAQLEALHQQQQDIQQILGKAEDVNVALEQLRQARARLSELDQLQMKASPLMQRRQQVQSQIDRHQTRLMARLDELRSLQQQLEAQQERQPNLQQAVLSVSQQIDYLEKRRAYQQQVREKGMERRTFLERLQEQQRKCERELAELDHKIAMLRREAEPNAVSVGRSADGDRGGWRDPVGEASMASLTLNSAPLQLTLSSDELAEPHRSHHLYPPCPLCDRPLDEQHWNLVLERHQEEQQEIRNQLWVIREQLTTSDREIRVLRQEYRDLDKELAQYGAVLERRGQLQEQLQGAADGHNRLQQVLAERLDVERSLQQQTYAADLHEELRLLEHSLNQLNYDDRDHALARGQVDRWRWAEIKHAELKQAQRRQAHLAERQPELEEAIALLEQQLQALHQSSLQQQIADLDRQIAEIGYNLEHHTALRQALRQAQPWQLRYQELVQAQHYYPQVQRRLEDLVGLLNNRTQACHAVDAQVMHLTRQLDQTPDLSAEIQVLERQTQQHRAQLDTQLANLGRLQQQQQQLAQLRQQQREQQQQLETVRRQYRVHQELAQAFGKNGIQALMIENVLPQLEAETNQILGRLSANQLHVQFVTQRSRKGAAQRTATKLIDTLDILISDVQGTRPYETYSGGEAFRVNFAIRLALARLLAQRSGTALQMLIIDEGFGTQDEAGCDRLIGAINAIAADFACILTVTHMPHLKEAFQTRIEVCKMDQGSTLRLFT